MEEAGESRARWRLEEEKDRANRFDARPVACNKKDLAQAHVGSCCMDFWHVSNCSCGVSSFIRTSMMERPVETIGNYSCVYSTILAEWKQSTVAGRES